VRPPGIEPGPEPWQGTIITTRPWSQAFLFREKENLDQKKKPSLFAKKEKYSKKNSPAKPF
tara:strand:+ start:30649 stop:30831 length:183 start_codon:yes stop_codon:yes gene_type:complete